MKVLIALALATAAVLVLSEERNPGMKVRITNHFLQEITRARKEYIENQMTEFKENFKAKMKHIMKMMKKRGPMGKKYKLEDAELTSFEDGKGLEITFKEPNILSLTWADMSAEVKLKVKAKGTVGTVTAKAALKSAELSLGFEKTEKGNIQFKKQACSIEFGDIEAKVEGWGDKDAMINEKITKKIDSGKAMLQNMICPYVEMGLAFINSMIDMTECKHEVPIFDNLYVAMCLVKNPEATADYMDFSFCGQTTYGNETANHEIYKPNPISMSDDGKTKMIYLYEALSMPNFFLMKAFDNNLLKVKITKDNHPKVAEHINTAINKARALLEKPELPEGVEVTTWFKAIDQQPIMTLTDNKMGMTAKIEIKHKFDNCDTCEEKEKTVKVNLAWTFEPALEEPKENKVFPRMGGKVTITKLEFEDVPEDILAKVGDKAKTSLEELINKLIEKWADKKEEQEDKYFPLKLWQIKNAQLVANNEDTVELNGDVAFNVKKMIELSHTMYEEDSDEGDEGDDDDDE
jgi:hypothetical protein